MITTALVPAGLEVRRDLAMDARIQDLVGSFLTGRKATIIRTYRQSLADFAAFLGAGSIDEAACSLLSRPHGEANHLALKYRANLIERDLSAATVNVRLAAIRSLAKLGQTLGIVAWTLQVANVKACPYRDTRGPGRDGVRALWSEAGKRVDAKGARDRALLRLLHDLGLRRAEVVALEVEDLDLDVGLVSVVGKGQTEKERYTLPGPTVTALKAWLNVRGTEPGPLFVNFDRAGKGCRLSGRSVHRIVKALGEEAGVKARPHLLRHAAITTALNRTNGNVRKVQRFSRHADVETLLRYDDARQDLAGEVARLVADSIGDIGTRKGN